MKKINHLIKILCTVSFVAALATVLSHNATSSTKFTKETGKKCTDCHSKIPKKGESEMYLTELGKRFKENGNKMPAEKK